MLLKIPGSFLRQDDKLSILSTNNIKIYISQYTLIRAL
jgi:hypothetical protein